MSDDPQRNIELKARDLQPKHSLEICKNLKAEDMGLIQQRDTYFKVANGRLKLREEQTSKAHLIQYQRADQKRERQSSYRIIEIAGDASVLRAALEEALGIRVTVVKTRHLWLYNEVRIHLDTVKELGSFIEFEAVAVADSDLSREYQAVGELREAFGVKDSQLCEIGYADLLERGLLPSGS